MFASRLSFSPRIVLLAAALGWVLTVSPRTLLAAEPVANTLDAYLPPEGTRAVVAVPDAPSAWQALDAAGLGDAMLPAFRGALASLEWALVATKPDTDATNQAKKSANATDKGATSHPTSGPPSASTPSPAGSPTAPGAALLCLARVADPERMRAILPGFERVLGASLASGNTPVGRSEEAIGDVAVTVLTNGDQASGYLLSGRLGVWATCTDAALLRDTARRIAHDTASAPSSSAKGPLAEARAAAARIHGEANAVPIATVLLPAPGPDTVAALGAVDWLRALLGGTPSKPVVAFLSLQDRTLQVEALASGATRSAGEAPKAVAAFPALGDACASPAGALVQWGTTRLNPEAMRQALLAQVDRSVAALPPVNRAGLTPASDLERQRLGLLRSTLADAPGWPLELGPEAWVVLNRFEFGREGELPAVDLVVAVRTRGEAATRAHLASWEAHLVAAASTPASGAHQPAAQASAPHFSERDEHLTADGQTVRLRWLDAPGLPAALRPAWALRGDLLCLALSPDSLAEALRRSATVAAPKAGDAAAPSPARSLVEQLGLPRPTSALVAWPARSAGPAAVLRVLAATAGEPWMAGLLGCVADRWPRAESVAVAREEDADGVRTVARVALTNLVPAPAAPGAASASPAEGAAPKTPGSARP